MKKSLLLATLVLTFVILARLAGYTSTDLLNVPAAIGGVAVLSLLLLAFNDYARKPRFRVRSARKTSPQTATPVTTLSVDAACDWTYTTRSV